MAGKFEPNKSGVYRVGFLIPNEGYETELISYNRKTDSWVSETHSNAFYHEHISSWMTADNSAIK